MTKFIDKLTKDKILGHFFKNNKMKHCIPNKIVLFFAYTKGILNPDDMKSMKEYHKHLKMSIFDFERSIVLLKEVLFEHNIDPIIVEEALNFYKTMKKDIVYDEEEEKIMADAAVANQDDPGRQQRIGSVLDNNGGMGVFTRNLSV
jgi:hypothetical protein